MAEATLFSRIHFARLENSPRLQRLLAFLQDYKPHSTLDIVKGAKICAVNSAVDELRENGFDIPCTRKGDIWEYQLTKPNNWYNKMKRDQEKGIADYS